MLGKNILILLVMSSAAIAQPQAPVEWGTARWLNIGTNYDYYQPMVLMGDTIVIGSWYYDPEHDPHNFPASIHSFDGGQTFSEWQRIDTGYYSGFSVDVAGSAGRAYAFIWTDHHAWVRRSLDGGQTWSTTGSQAVQTATTGFASGLQVIRVDGHANGAGQAVLQEALSNNGGDTWQSALPISVDTFYSGYNSLAVTSSRTLLLARDGSGYSDIFVATGNRNGTNWTPFEELPGQPISEFFYSRCVAGDTSSETAVVLSEWESNVGGDLYIHRTTDGGLSWESPRALTEGGTLIMWDDPHPSVFCRGKLWGVAYENFQPDNPQDWGLYWRFSGNHGKDWYPAQRVDTFAFGIAYSNGQFVNNDVQLFWTAIDTLRYPDSLFDDYRTATGHVVPDTVTPESVLDLVAPDTIRVNDTLHFQATVEDNDTLSEVRVMLSDSNGALTQVLLTRAEQFFYQGTFVVPHAGLFQYRGEAEDFWENIGVDPDSGWHAFATEGFSESHDPGIAQPHTYAVSVYPNPSNGWPTLTLSPEWIQNRSATVIVYNVLGQKFYDSRVKTQTVKLGELDAGTGLYFARVTNGLRTAVVKFLVVK